MSPRGRTRTQEPRCQLCGKERSWLVLAFDSESSSAEFIVPGGLARDGVEVMDICPLGHATTRLMQTPGMLDEQPPTSDVVAMWGSTAAGKTHLVRRLMAIGYPSWGSDLGIRVTKPKAKGLVEVMAFRGTAQRTARGITTSEAIIELCKRRGVPPEAAAADLITALTQRGLDEEAARLWGRTRVALPDRRVLRHEATDVRWVSELWFIDEPGELHMPEAAREDSRPLVLDRNVNRVVWFFDTSLYLADQLDGLELVLAQRFRDQEFMDAPPGSVPDEDLRRLAAPMKQIANARLDNAARRNVQEWATDPQVARRAGVVLTKLDLVWSLLTRADETGGTDARPAIERVFARSWERGVRLAGEGLGLLAEEWLDREPGVSPEARALLSGVPRGNDAQARKIRVEMAAAVLRAFGTPETFWNLVSTGEGQTFTVPVHGAAARFSLEGIDDYQRRLIGHDWPPEIGVRDVVSTVVGRGLLGFMTLFSGAQLELANTQSVPEAYFLTSLIDEPSLAPNAASFERQLVNDDSAGAGVRHLHAWLCRPLFMPPVGPGAVAGTGGAS